MNTIVSSKEIEDICHQFYSQLMEHSQGHSNDDLLACMLANWSNGMGALPVFMGLVPEQFHAMLAHHYPGFDVQELLQPQVQIDPERCSERNELLALLLQNRANESESENWIAGIVSTACMMQNHLWQDLGLWSRNDLTRLLQENFPALAARNDRNMKWKKFFYKQLCNAEGIDACRSPSCDVCVDFSECFGAEE